MTAAVPAGEALPLVQAAAETKPDSTHAVLPDAAVTRGTLLLPAGALIRGERKGKWKRELKRRRRRRTRRTKENQRTRRTKENQKRTKRELNPYLLKIL